MGGTRQGRSGGQRRTPSAPAPRQAPAPATGTGRLIGLQRAAGNAAVAAVVQRVGVDATFHETVHNKEDASGRAIAKGFTGGSPDTVANASKKSYEMKREGGGVTVVIRIRFVQQPRNTTPPPDPNPSNLPALGALTNSPSEIPASDPSGRRAWATATAASATALWNTRQITFNSLDHPPQDGTGAGSRAPAPAPVPIRLPVTFRSEAVFGLNDDAHQQVVVHPPTSIPGTPGHPIDAGNWYRQDSDPAKRSKSYPASDEMIYAHEYGHMIGIPDEYSQSNAQMNALIHQAAPATAASSMKALEAKAVERMALKAMAKPLTDQLRSAIPLMMGALTAKKALATRKLAAAARAGVVSAEVRDALRTQLTAEADATRGPQVPTAVAFETTKNFSNLDIASGATAGAFDVGAVTGLISSAYANALAAPHATNVAVAGFDDVKIKLSSGVAGMSATGAPLAAAATAGAATLVGPAGVPGLPQVAPPTSLVGQLAALPATWSAAGSTMESAVTPAAFSTAMTAALSSSAAAAAVAAAAPGAVVPAKLASTRALYRRALAMVDSSARAAARQVANDLLLDTFKPTLEASVTALQASLGAEVARISTTAPAGLVAAGPPDPNMAAVVAAMKTRLEVDKALSLVAEAANAIRGTGGSSRDPTKGGGTGPTQSVTYSAQGLMGSTKSAAARADQFGDMVAAFNAALRVAPREDAFTVKLGP